MSDEADEEAIGRESSGADEATDASSDADVAPKKKREKSAEKRSGGETEPSEEPEEPTASATAAGDGFVELKIRRQDSASRGESRRWEKFRVPKTPGMTVLGALRAIRHAPSTTEGNAVAPPAFEGECCEELCGACTMLIGGRPRLACGVTVDEVSPKGKPIVLEPLSKFLLVRDLVVDRSKLDQGLSSVEAWTATDGYGGDGSSQTPRERDAMDARSGCIECGACLEACPQYGAHSEFVGAAALNEVRRLDLHPVAARSRGRRLEHVMGPGGVAGCGKAQNCVEVCPVALPLTESIAALSRDATKKALRDWFRG